MPKQETRPIWRLLVVCYFLPLTIALLLGSNDNSSPNMAFVLAIAVVALLALVLFLKLRQWEYSLRRKAAQLQGEPVQPVQSGLTKVEQDRYLEELKQKEEHIFGLIAENRASQNEREALLEIHEAVLQELRQERQLHEEHLQQMIHQLQTDLLEKQLHVQMQENLITGLRVDINNLNFELKTLLKVESKNK